MTRALKCTYVDSDARHGENGDFLVPFCWYVSVEFMSILVPFDRIEFFTFQVVFTREKSFVTDEFVFWHSQFNQSDTLDPLCKSLTNKKRVINKKKVE